MATDVAGFKAKLLAERQAVQDAISTIDVPAEQALFDTAAAQYETARRVFEKKTERWTLVNDKLQRLTILDAQIALLS